MAYIANFQYWGEGCAWPLFSAFPMLGDHSQCPFAPARSTAASQIVITSEIRALLAHFSVASVEWVQRSRSRSEEFWTDSAEGHMTVRRMRLDEVVGAPPAGCAGGRDLATDCGGPVARSSAISSLTPTRILSLCSTGLTSVVNDQNRRLMEIFHCRTRELRDERRGIKLCRGLRRTCYGGLRSCLFSHHSLTQC